MRSRRWRNTLLAVGMALGICAAPATAGAAAGAPVPVPTFTPKLTLIGTVNLSALPGGAAANANGASSTSSSPRYRTVDNQVITHRPKGAGRHRRPH